MLSLTPTNKKIIALLTYLIVPISGLGIDIFVPSLPAVTTYFHIANSQAQLTVTTYMLGLGIMQLVAGPISDRYGRRQPFIISMTAFILTTILVPFSSSINQLLILRALQGAAAGITIVPLRSVTLDLFQGRELAKMMNYMTISWSIGPIIAPAIGGYLQHYANWKFCFYFLAGYSVIAFALLFKLMPETSIQRHMITPHTILQRYSTIFRHPIFLTGMFANTCLYSLIILFSIVGPFLLQDTLKLSSIAFGHYTLLMGLSWFMGNITNRFLLNFNNEIKIQICLWTMLSIACLMLGLSIYLPLQLINIILPTMMILFLGGIIFPNNFAMILAPFPNLSGSANALGGALIFFLTGLSGGLGTILKASSETPLAIAYIVLISLCLILDAIKIRYLKIISP